MPGFPRAAARTLHELQMAAVSSEALRALGPAGGDLARMLDGVEAEALRAGTVTRAAALTAATTALRERPESLAATTVVLLDVAATSPAEDAFLAALVSAAGDVFAVVPAGDERTNRTLTHMGGVPADESAPFGRRRPILR